MRGDENNPEDWFKLAKRDLETAELLAAHDKIDAAAAPAQQAAEKILKGKLVHLGITPPRWHNLLELRRLLPAELQSGAFTQEIAELLSEEYLESRYPGTHWDPPPSENEIKLAIHATRKLAEKLAPEYFPDDNARD